MDLIRPIKTSDYPVLRLYWAMSGEEGVAYPPESSYVFERDGKLLYAVAVYHFKAAPMALVEGLIKDPNKASDFNALSALQAHIENAAKEAGAKKLLGYASKPRLVEHYKRLGYTITSQAVTNMAKDL